MKSIYLPVHLVNAALEAREAISGLDRRAVAFRGALQICSLYRRIAIGSLLLEGLPGSFFEFLSRSGRAFKFFLDGNHPADEEVLSRMAPFLDAIACGDVQAAGTIAAAAKKAPRLDVEYEDDYLYFLFLMKKFYLGADEAELNGMLDRYAELLKGARDPRYDVCRSLQRRRVDQFEQAQAEMAASVSERARQAHRAGTEPEEVIAVDSNVSVEGLALVRLAEGLGMKIAPILPLIPEVTRSLPPIAHDDVRWKAPIMIMGREIDDDVVV